MGGRVEQEARGATQAHFRGGRGQSKEKMPADRDMLLAILGVWEGDHSPY